MTKKELSQYLLQSLNMGLGALMQGETSYTNSFDCKIMEEGFLFLPRLPAGYIIDDETLSKNIPNRQCFTLPSLHTIETKFCLFHGT